MRALAGYLLCVTISLSHLDAFALDPSSANPAPVAASTTTLATVEALSGKSKMTIDKVTRKNNVVTVKGIVENVSNDVYETTLEQTEMYVLNEEKGIKYFPLMDEGKRLIASNINYGGLHFRIEQGERNKFWVKFTAPPAEVKTVNLVFEGFEIIENAAISDEG